MEYGIQMYSVRDVAEHDLVGALEKVAQIGYRFVEFAGFFGHPAAEVRAVLDRCGLHASGTHTQLTELVNDFEGTVRYHREIGCSDIIIPWADLTDKAKLDAFIGTVNALQPKLEAEGFRLHYHNHSHEFRPNPDGSLIYPEIETRTKLLLEVDTYWAFVAGNDPVAMLERLKDRVRVIHLKDGSADGKMGAPLGQGNAPVKLVREKAVELGVPIVVESENLNPDGITEVTTCFNFLRTLG